MSVSLYLGIALLGGFGAAIRVLLEAKLSSAAGAAFPVGTLVVNLLGALLLGLLVGVGISGDLLLLLSLGLLGSFTTFSTWMLQSYSLAGRGMNRLAVLNIGLSLAAGLLAVWLGDSLGSLI